MQTELNSQMIQWMKIYSAEDGLIVQICGNRQDLFTAGGTVNKMVKYFKKNNESYQMMGFLFLYDRITHKVVCGTVRNVTDYKKLVCEFLD